ncbi:MAG: hypothetical protein IPM42_11015 [Saprospiraceae bacterium]|nr:hypothetical protein [Saprospiraceae bacterium]
MSNSTQKKTLNSFPPFLIKMVVILGLFSNTLSGQLDCSLLFNQIIQPSSCYVSDGVLNITATDQPGNPCNRTIYVTRANFVVAQGTGQLTVSGLPSGEYLIIAENECGCPRQSQVEVLSGGTPTHLKTFADNGSGYNETKKVYTCNGSNLKIGVQSLGTSGLELRGPGGFVDNTPDGNSFWIIPNIQLNQSGLYTIEYTNNDGCVSTTQINVTVGSLEVVADTDKAGCIGTSHTLSVNISGVAACQAECTEGTDSLLVLWDLNDCNANGQANQISYEEFTPVYPSAGNCVSVSASNVYRDQGEHSCALIGTDGIGMCVSSMISCDPSQYNDLNAIKFQVTINPAQAGRISGLSFMEASPLDWMTLNGSKGINNYNTKFLIRIYKNDILIFSQDDLVSDRDWNLEYFNFSDNPEFYVTETSIFRFELMGYCVVPRGGSMTGWEVDDIRIFGGCCEPLPADESYSVIWSTGETTEEIIVNPLTTTQYSVSVTDCKNCVSTKQINVTVYPLPVAEISGNNAVCIGGSVVLTASGGVSYLWSTGDISPVITVTPGSTTEYFVTVTSSDACTAIASKIITVNPLPSVTITGNNIICVGKSTTLTANGAMTYLWNTGETTQSITVNPTVSTTYSVMATDENLCAEQTSIFVTVNPLPDPEISGEQVICIGQNISLTASGGVQYLWSTGEISSVISVAPNISTTFIVTVTDQNGCSATKSHNVTVNPLPLVSIVGNATLCVGASTLLTATGGQSYVWSTGETTASIMANPGLNTLYTVTATDVNGCTATASRAAIVNSLPTVTIEGDLSLCEGQQSTLTAITNGISLLWNTGSSTLSIAVQPTQSTIYSVTVTDSNGCTNSASRIVKINKKPTVSIAPTTPVCEGQSVTLSAIVTGTTICPDDCTDELLAIWDFNACNAEGIVNQLSYSEFVPQVVSTGNFASLSCTIASRERGDHSCTPDGQGGIGICFSSMESCDPNQYNPLNGLRFSISVSPEEYGSITRLSFKEQSPVNWVTMNGSTGINNINSKYLIRVYKNGVLIYSQNDLDTERDWNTETFDFSDHPEFTVEEFTTFTFELYGYCTENRGGIAGWEVDDIRLFGGACVSTPTIDNVTYLWSTGATTSTIIVNPNTTTIYSVTVTDCNLCTSSDSGQVVIYPLPVPVITGPNKICLGESVTLTVSVATSYLWSTGETTQSIIINPAVSANYSVTVTDSNGCTASTSTNVVVDTLPNINVSGNTILCVGESTQLTATGGINYIWSTGETSASILVSPNTTTTYSVTSTDINGCINTRSVTVTVNSLPTANISGNNIICQGSSTMLTASGGVVYLWSTGDVSQTITVSPLTTTTYRVTVIDGNGCQANHATVVTVNTLPIVNITGNLTLCVGQSTTLTATGGDTFTWSTGETTYWITVNPLVTTTYSVTVNDGNNCSASTSVTVVVNALPTPTITGTTEICIGDTGTLTASGGVSYVWSTGATTASINVSPTVTTTYIVTATDSNGCTGTASSTVTVNPLPVVNITGKTDICVDECTTLTATGGETYSWSGVSGGGFTCDGSYFVGGLQNGAPQSLFRYNAGGLSEIGPLGTNWVNAMGYYCGAGNQPELYALRMPGTDPLSAIRANFTKINPLTGAATVLGEVPQPPNPYGVLGITGIINYVADISKEGIYYFPAVAAVINPFTFEIVNYTIYPGKIDVNNHGNGSNVSYEVMNVNPDCKPYIDACVEAFQRFALDPSTGEPSGGIQDWALNPDGTTFYSYFGIENALFTMDLATRTVSCPGRSG